MAQSGVGLAINGVLYMLINLGAPIVPYSRKGAFVLGIIGLAGSIWMVWRLLKHHGFQARQLAPYLALQAYALCSAAMNAAGRVGYGTYFALNSRYIIMTTLFWVPAAVFAYLLARTNCAAPLLITRPGLRRTLVNAGAWLMLSLLLLGSAQGCLTWLRWRPELIEAQNEMLLGQEGEAWAKLFPYKEVLRQRADVIKRYRLSIFRQTAQ
jgi:hypothetical protein